MFASAPTGLEIHSARRVHRGGEPEAHLLAPPGWQSQEALFPHRMRDIRIGGGLELECRIGQGRAVGVVVIGSDLVTLRGEDVRAHRDQAPVQVQRDALDHPAGGGLLRRQHELVAAGLPVRAQRVVFIDVLEIQKCRESSQRVAEEGVLGERVNLHLVKGGIENPHRVPVANRRAWVGRADLAPEFIRHTEVHHAIARDRFIEQMRGALLGKGGLKAGLLLVQIVKLLEQRRAIRGGELALRAHEGWSGQQAEKGRAAEPGCEKARGHIGVFQIGT